MPLSLEQIRELNKVTLYVTCCTDPVPADAGTEGAGVWSLGMYSGGGFPLHGDLTVGDALKSFPGFSNTKKLGWVSDLATIVGHVGHFGFGLTPQFDMVRKMELQSTDPLRFTMECYLCLEHSVEEDFLKPLSRLFFLTYPVRSTGIFEAVTERGAAVVGELSSGGKDVVAGWVSDGWISESIGKSLTGLLEGMSQWLRGDGVKDFGRAFGEVYLLHCPPTFRSLFMGKGGAWLDGLLGLDWSSHAWYGGNRVRYIETAGSGLSVCYGGSLISNCVIRGLNIKIPKLYYRGGYPGVIEVSIEFETLRLGSANMYRDLIYGSVDLK